MDSAAVEAQKEESFDEDEDDDDEEKEDTWDARATHLVGLLAVALLAVHLAGAVLFAFAEKDSVLLLVALLAGMCLPFFLRHDRRGDVPLRVHAD